MGQHMHGTCMWQQCQDCNPCAQEHRRLHRYYGDAIYLLAGHVDYSYIMEMLATFWRAINWKIIKLCAGRAASPVCTRASIVDYRDIAEMVAIDWRAIYVIPTYVKHINSVTLSLSGGSWQASTR